jgi:superfamily II DNA helicase RecQ
LNIILLKTRFYHFLNGLSSYSSTNMATGARWQDPNGLETINTIVKTLIPAWRDGLHPLQLELISTILDGQDILCCTATGAGKSAAFAIPGLVLNEYNAHPDAYPAGLPTRKRPIGVVMRKLVNLLMDMCSDEVGCP